MLRQLAGRFVDRAVLRRPNYDAALTELARQLELAESDADVAAAIAEAAHSTLGVTHTEAIDDPFPDEDPSVVISNPSARIPERYVNCALVIRLRSVEAPHWAIVAGSFAAGRRLLSDDVRLLEAFGRLAARRIDSLRVAEERLAHSLREQDMLRLATEAELRSLRAQLNPHFLFNALTTVGYLIQQAPPRALDTLLRLTTVLRSVLRQSTREFSTLGEEIELVCAYLDIERARYEERLDVDIDVPPSAHGIALPPLLLQPLVENAVKHGIAPQLRGGLVRISASVTQGLLHVIVEDSGTGFEKDTRSRTGVGLRNVEDRLRAQYGDAARLDIRSAPGRGTRIKLTLPSEPRRPQEARFA
jgi:signal transduction histidine kinase